MPTDVQASSIEGAPAVGQWFSPSRDAASSRLRSFLPNAGKDYARTRNYDLGPDNRENVSLLSPYVRHRLVTEQEIVTEALEHHSLAAAEKFVQEVCWRTYSKGWLEQRPELWPAYLADVESGLDRFDADEALEGRYRDAVEGRTGIACFDFWAQELTETGYLHNHARMWFASIWIHTLDLPWALGANFFYRHLLDGDPASNTLSWRWVAGLHTHGKTYLARGDNIAKYTDGRFSKTDGLARSAQPQDETIGRFDRRPIPPSETKLSDGQALLLIHEEDLHPESLPLDTIEIAALAILPCVETAEQRAQPVLDFKTAALDDARARARQHFGVDAIKLDHRAPSGSGQLGASLAAALKRADCRFVVTAAAPVGPTRTLLDALVGGEGQPSVVRIRRDWDGLFWPHASAGFFKLKKQIPSVLAQLGLISSDGA